MEDMRELPSEDARELTDEDAPVQSQEQDIQREQEKVLLSMTQQFLTALLLTTLKENVKLLGCGGG